MKTDAQLLQDMTADSQRAAARHAGPRRGQPPGLQIQVTLSSDGPCTDADPADTAVSQPAWTISLPADAAAAPR
jgi:hypothetical protein